MELWIILTIASAVLFGIKDLFGRKFLAHHDVLPIEITLQNYMLFVLMGLLFFIPVLDIAGALGVLHWLAFKALLAITILSIYYYLLERYEVSQVAPVINTSPALLIVFSFLFLGELLTPLQISGILVVVVGTYVLHLTVENRHKKRHEVHAFLKFADPRFYCLAFIMVLALALIPIAEKFILAEVNLGTNIFFSGIIAVLFMAGYLVYKKKLLDGFKHLRDNPQSLLVSVPHVLSDFLIIAAIAIPTALVSLIIPLRRTSTLISAVAGGILFHENHLKLKLLATAIMIFGVFLLFV